MFFEIFNMVAATTGWILLLIGIIMVLHDGPNDILGKIACIFAFGIICFVMNLGALANMHTVKSVVWVKPSMITKTNNVVMVHLIGNNGTVLFDKVFNDAAMWNSTNIMVKVSKGLNLYDCKVEDVYGVEAR